MLNTKEIEFIKEKLSKKFKPEKVILFGSQARMDSDKNSDVDLLVITNPNGNRRKLMLEMDRALKGLNYARDIVILSSIEFEKDKMIAGTIARYAFKEGRIIYGSW
jgi:predicted nucleotidyltransferase